MMRVERIFSVRFQNISARQDLAATAACDFPSLYLFIYLCEEDNIKINYKPYNSNLDFTDQKMHKGIKTKSCVWFFQNRCCYLPCVEKSCCYNTTDETLEAKV